MKRKASRMPAFERPSKLSKASESVTVGRQLSVMRRAESVQKTRLQPLRLASMRQRSLKPTTSISISASSSTKLARKTTVTKRLAPPSRLEDRFTENSASVSKGKRSNRATASAILSISSKAKIAKQPSKSKYRYPKFPRLIPPSQQIVVKPEDKSEPDTKVEDSASHGPVPLRKRSTLKLEDSPPPSQSSMTKGRNHSTIKHTPSLTKKDTEILADEDSDLPEAEADGKGAPKRVPSSRSQTGVTRKRSTMTKSSSKGSS